LYEFKDIIESEVIDIEKLRKVTFRGRWVHGWTVDWWLPAVFKQHHLNAYLQRCYYS